MASTPARTEYAEHGISSVKLRRPVPIAIVIIEAHTGALDYAHGFESLISSTSTEYSAILRTTGQQWSWLAADGDSW